jgi:MFS family permease
METTSVPLGGTPTASLGSSAVGTTSRGEFARGWTVLLAATVGVGLGITGLPFYSFGQFVRPLTQEFGWNRGEISGGILCLMIGTVVTSPFVGRAVDKFGFRTVALISQIGLALGFLGISLVGQSVAGFYVAWLALSFLGSGTSPIVWTRAVAGRFERSRGFALGIMLCGTGLVAILAPLVISQIVAGFGWRTAYRVLAATLIVVGLPITYTLLRGSAEKTTAVVATHVGASLREAARDSAFWRLEAAFFLISIVVGGVIVHLPSMLVDRGFTPIGAAGVVGTLGYAIIVGRLSLGFMVDRLPPALVGAALVMLSAISCVMLAQGIAPLAAVLLLGLCAGAEVDLLAFLISRLFGLKHYAQIYGCGISAFTAGAGVGPILAGRVHDGAGSYAPALYGFAVLIVIASLLLASLGKRVKASHDIVPAE